MAQSSSIDTDAKNTLKRPLGNVDDSRLLYDEVVGSNPKRPMTYLPSADSKAESSGVNVIRRLTPTNLRFLQKSLSGYEGARHSNEPPSVDPSDDPQEDYFEASESGSIIPEDDVESLYASERRRNHEKEWRLWNHLTEHGLDREGFEEPDREDMDLLRAVMARERDSPEPDTAHFCNTLGIVSSKNTESFAKRCATLHLQSLGLSRTKLTALVSSHCCFRAEIYQARVKRLPIWFTKTSSLGTNGAH